MQKVVLEIPIEANHCYAEANRTLATNIKIYEKGLKVVAITSTRPLEGKSTIAFNLAKTLAEIGENVIFIDADLRKSNITKRYSVNRDVTGLKHLISGKNSIEEIIYSSNITGLSIIFAGESNKDSIELINAQCYSDLIFHCRTHYDYVIIDTPAFNSIADATIIIKDCEATLLVIEEGKTSPKSVMEVIEKIEGTNCRIIGTVINKAILKENLNLDCEYYKV